MTEEYQDIPRKRLHRRGWVRRLRTKIRTLLVVMGGVALFLAALVFALSFFQARSDGRIQRELSALLLAGGGVMLLLYAGFFLIPDQLHRRGSASFQRRLALSRAHQKSRRGAATQSGLALVLVLVMLGLVATLVLETQVTARALLREQQASARARDLQRAAFDAARAALQRLADDDDLAVDATNEAWAATEVMNAPLGIQTRVTVADANRFFDLNNVGAKMGPEPRPAADVIMDIMTLCGDTTPSQFEDALRDWVDEDADGFRESPFYMRKQPPYPAPSRPLYNLAETAWVEGAKPDMFARHPRYSTMAEFKADLLDQVTALPAARERPIPINLNTASPWVLQGVLGFGQEEAVKAILTLRTIKPIRFLTSLVPALSPSLLDSVRPWVDVRSRFFLIHAQAYADERRQELRLLAARDASGRVEVLQCMR